MQPLTKRLDGEQVAMVPLSEHHREDLWAAAQHPQIWAWLPKLDANREYFDGWFSASLEQAQVGEVGPFATVDRESGRAVGSSRYLNIRPYDRVLEIGWTWLTPSAWGTGANAEAKLLMMSHAFDTLDCLRVEFKTDARNERSRRALAAIPAQFEGVLRNHLTMPDVGVRDSAYYSVIDSEWPDVRTTLEQRLGR